mmetsp:Transcript_2824/g.10793  ORF Transcript_2824/g.10793 Transcript_2824/m.10793 type:complete len:237 (-) Transcript_2824:1734-2444(-)
MSLTPKEMAVLTPDFRDKSIFPSVSMKKGMSISMSTTVAADKEAKIGIWVSAERESATASATPIESKTSPTMNWSLSSLAALNPIPTEISCSMVQPMPMFLIPCSAFLRSAPNAFNRSPKLCPPSAAAWLSEPCPPRSAVCLWKFWEFAKNSSFHSPDAWLGIANSDRNISARPKIISSYRRACISAMLSVCSSISAVMAARRTGSVSVASILRPRIFFFNPRISSVTSVKIFSIS